MFLSPLHPLEVFLLIPPHPVALTQLRSLSSPRLGLKDLRRLKTSRVFVDNASPTPPAARRNARVSPTARGSRRGFW